MHRLWNKIIGESGLSLKPIVGTCSCCYSITWAWQALCWLQSPKNAQGWCTTTPVTGNNQQPWGDPCQLAGKQTAKCTSFSTNLPGDRIQGVLQGKHWMAPAVGWSQSSAWSRAFGCGDADIRARSGNIEMKAVGIMVPQIHSSLPPLGTVCHLLEYSWPPQRYTVSENKGQSCARQLERPNLHQTGVVIYSLVRVHRLSMPRLGKVWAGAHAAGRQTSDVPWHCGESHGDETTCSQALMASGWDLARRAMEGPRIRHIAAQVQGEGRQGFVILL